MSNVTTLDDELSIDNKQAVAVPVHALKSRLDATLSGKRKILTIHNDSADGGSDAVFLSINEFAYQIPRGVPCNVPSEVVEIMRHAIVTTYERDKISGAVVERRTPRYAFSDSDAPDQPKPEAANAASAKKRA